MGNMATERPIRRLIVVAVFEEYRSEGEHPVRQPSAPTSAITRAHRSGVFVWADSPAEEIVAADRDAGPPSERAA